jgi:hypothetical protein
MRLGWGRVRMWRGVGVPWPVILDVVFLNFLDVMVRLWVIHPLGATDKLVFIRERYKSGEEQSTYYFQAKSLNKQSGGNTTAMPQKTGLVQSLPLTPVHSVEKLSRGAISA